MKKIGKLLLILIASLAMSCDAIPIFDSYYVKFEGITTNYRYSEPPVFTMQAGKYQYILHGGECSETLGPISKTDIISFKVKGGNINDMSRKIYVCRNDEPFVLVAHSNGNEELTYTIDF